MGMKAGQEFDDFVRARSAALMRTAYALVGDHGHAEDLLQTALLRTARRWASARHAPEAYARQVLVNLCRDRVRWLPGVQRGVHVVLLTAWVDRNDVVHQISLRTTQQQTSDPLYLQKKKNGALVVVVPSQAFLDDARAMARKLRKHYGHVAVRVDPSVGAKIRHYYNVTSASATFSGFGVHQVITAPRHSVPVFGRG